MNLNFPQSLSKTSHSLCRKAFPQSLSEKYTIHNLASPPLFYTHVKNPTKNIHIWVSVAAYRGIFQFKV